jgi:hypothetical protein
MMGRWLAGIAVSVVAVACGSESNSNVPADNCSNFAGAYAVTTEVVDTDCPVGKHAISASVTWTFVQTAPNCGFTMTNSLYPSSQYTGYFTMNGANAKVTWTKVDPAPVAGGLALSYTSENLTVVPGVAPAPGTLSGSFAWSNAHPCSGTTNVCHGSIPAGCLTPN